MILKANAFGNRFANAQAMQHIPIERLYDFVFVEQDLALADQVHLIGCKFCVAWLDACVNEKVASLTMESPKLEKR